MYLCSCCSQFPLATKYTHFSSPHLSYIPIKNIKLQNPSHYNQWPCPVSFQLSINPVKQPFNRWCFNTSLISDPDFTGITGQNSFFKKEWALFLDQWHHRNHTYNNCKGSNERKNNSALFIQKEIAQEIHHIKRKRNKYWKRNSLLTATVSLTQPHRLRKN